MDYEIVFPPHYFERREAETPAKGWLDVTVRVGRELQAVIL